MRSLLKAIDYVHKQNIVHRDLKPDNILVDDEDDLETIKIADFGLSAEYNFNSIDMITRLGTIVYMAPELYGKKQYSKRVDTWALGIIMYILLEGRHPLYRHGRDTEQSFAEKLKNPKWKFSERTSEIARDLFTKLCKTHSGERYDIFTAMTHPWITRELDSPCPLTKIQELEQYEQEIKLRKGLMSVYFLSRVSYQSQKDLTSFLSSYREKLAEVENEGKKTAEPGPRLKPEEEGKDEDRRSSTTANTKGTKQLLQSKPGLQISLKQTEHSEDRNSNLSSNRNEK